MSKRKPQFPPVFPEMQSAMANAWHYAVRPEVMAWIKAARPAYIAARERGEATRIGRATDARVFGWILKTLTSKGIRVSDQRSFDDALRSLALGNATPKLIRVKPVRKCAESTPQPV